jgi:hypothetical protein
MLLMFEKIALWVGKLCCMHVCTLPSLILGQVSLWEREILPSSAIGEALKAAWPRRSEALEIVVATNTK